MTKWYGKLQTKVSEEQQEAPTDTYLTDNGNLVRLAVRKQKRLDYEGGAGCHQGARSASLDAWIWKRYFSRPGGRHAG